jgi:hypothetical protein
MISFNRLFYPVGAPWLAGAITSLTAELSAFSVIVGDTRLRGAVFFEKNGNCT